MRRSEKGATLIEILVTIVIVAFGLLGLAGLQMKMQMSEAEAYQRSQALMLLNDMASRIANNRLNTASYISSSNTLGVGYNCASMSTSTQAALDLKEWCLALEGAGESLAGQKTGAMINGRGCIQSSSTGDGDIVVTVVWQGLTPVSAPPTTVTCGANNYNGGTGSVCTNDRCRRFLTTIVRIGSLV